MPKSFLFTYYSVMFFLDTYGVSAVFRLKTLNPPAVLNVRVAYLRVPCGKSLMWVANPAHASEYGEREEAQKVANLLQLAENTYEIEEFREMKKPTNSPKKQGGSIFD